MEQALRNEFAFTGKGERLTREEIKSRNWQMLNLRVNGKFSLKEIGDMHGLTRERIRQILESFEVDCKRYPHLNKRFKRAEVRCHGCGRKFPVRPFLARARKRHWCSDECYMNHMHPWTICHACGKVFRRPRAQLHGNDSRYKGRHFCDRKCFTNGNTRKENET